jgi:DNA-binding NarL/FixJ family response regulator
MQARCRLVSGGQWPETVAVTVYRGADPLNGERPTEVGGDAMDDFGSPGTPGPETEAFQVNVLVGSDDPFTRQAFRRGASSPGINVLGAGTVASVADELVAQTEPDVVLLDVQTTAAAALAAIQHIRDRVPRARILACSAPAGNEFGLLCLSAGAWGYVSKEIDLDLLPRLLRALAQGEAVIPRALGTELVRRLVHSTPAGQHPPAALTPPECRLLELLRTGQTLRQAARELGISVATARRHFGSARRKLASHPASSMTEGASPTQRINPPEVS